MRMIGKAFAKKLFGAKYERLTRTLFMDVIVFWGLYIAGFQVQIASFIRVLMISTFTAGVMWQALSSGDNAVELKHMLMLPQQPKNLSSPMWRRWEPIRFLQRQGCFLAVLLAVSAWKPIEMIGMVHQYASCGPYGCRSLLSKKILVCGRALGCCHSIRNFILWK